MKKNLLFFFIASIIMSSCLTKDSLDLNKILEKNRFNRLEKFTFVNKKGFTYKGKGGTILVFPSNVFDCDEKDSVTLNICEYADIESIVKANLTTTSDSVLLETNGMIYCKAYNKEKEISLKKGKSFTCMFNKPNNNNYKLFEGIEQNGQINWINPISPQRKLPLKLNSKIDVMEEDEDKREALYICAYGTENSVLDETALVFTNDTLTNLISFFNDKFFISYKDLVPCTPDESFLMYFTLTKTGDLVYKNTDLFLNSKLLSNLVVFFEKMPRMKGYNNNETGVKEDLDLSINIAPNKRLSKRLEADQNNIEKVLQFLADKEEKEKLNQLEIERAEKEQIEKEKIEYERIKKEQIEKEKIEKERNKNELEVLNKLSNFEKIVFNSNKLGWINCDRFVKDRRRKINIDFKLLEEYNSYSIKIIFTSIKGVYEVYNYKAQNIPINEPIKILFLGVKNNEMYLYSTRIETSNDTRTIEINAEKIDPTQYEIKIENALKND